MQGFNITSVFVSNVCLFFGVVCVVCLCSVVALPIDPETCLKLSEFNKILEFEYANNMMCIDSDKRK